MSGFLPDNVEAVLRGLIAEPIVQHVMQADGVDEEKLLRFLLDKARTFGRRQTSAEDAVTAAYPPCHPDGKGWLA